MRFLEDIDTTNRRGVLETALTEFKAYAKKEPLIDERDCNHLPYRLEAFTDQIFGFLGFWTGLPSSHYRSQMPKIMAGIEKRLEIHIAAEQPLKIVIANIEAQIANETVTSSELLKFILNNSDMAGSAPEALLLSANYFLLNGDERLAFKVREPHTLAIILTEQALDLAEKIGNDASAKRAAFRLAEIFANCDPEVKHRHKLCTDKTNALSFLVKAQEHGSSTATELLKNKDPVAELITQADPERASQYDKLTKMSGKTNRQIHNMTKSLGLFITNDQRKASYAATCESSSRDEYHDKLAVILS